MKRLSTNQIRQLWLEYFHELGHDYLRRYRSIIRALTPDEITAAARRHLDMDRLTIAVFGPE